MKILIVDDSAFMRNMLKNILKDTPHEFFEAGNGDEAVRVFQEQQPQLVFMDVIMPGKNGIEVLKDLKGLNQNVNVIMCTSVGGQERIIQECVEAGASDFITKPFVPEEVVNVVGRFDQ